jgi:hypothetical protein
MNAGLLFLPAVVVAGFVLLFATTALERLIVLPVRPLPKHSQLATYPSFVAGDNPRLASGEPHNKKEGPQWASS